MFASELPMSIIIVGVGDANFDNMRTLDGDHLAGGHVSSTPKEGEESKLA